MQIKRDSKNAAHSGGVFAHGEAVRSNLFIIIILNGADYQCQQITSGGGYPVDSALFGERTCEHINFRRKLLPTDILGH